MLESMKRYAADNPDFVVEQTTAPDEALESSISGSGVQVTRQVQDDLLSVAPVQN